MWSHPWLYHESGILHSELDPGKKDTGGEFWLSIWPIHLIFASLVRSTYLQPSTKLSSEKPTSSHLGRSVVPGLCRLIRFLDFPFSVDSSTQHPCGGRQRPLKYRHELKKLLMRENVLTFLAKNAKILTWNVFLPGLAFLPAKTSFCYLPL